MSGATAIAARGLGKRFRLGARRERYATFREAIGRSARRAAGRLASVFSRARGGEGSGVGGDFHWALRDVSFEVGSGEVMGVIGRNGSGKSTLLKVLSRITEPTEGEADIRGRVGSLLEVGTGFHMELSGRENIYLNGAILGMGRREIDRKFDRIVAFAEVEKFIDTAVKHYSSGMYLRLAFAVAAHLEPDILLVDEVLAVGDLEFQRKCLGRMGEVANEGRTVLFVSHNLGTVRQLCRSGLVLNGGRVAYHGGVSDALARYAKVLATEDEEGSGGEGSGIRRGDGFENVEIAGSESEDWAGADSAEGFEVRGTLDVSEDCPQARLIAIVEGPNGECLAHHFVDFRRRGASVGEEGGPVIGERLEAGRHALRLRFPPLWLIPGPYGVHLKFLGTTATGRSVRVVSPSALLDVVDRKGQYQGIIKALMIPDVQWTVERKGR